MANKCMPANCGADTQHSCINYLHMVYNNVY